MVPRSMKGGLLVVGMVAALAACGAPPAKVGSVQAPAEGAIFHVASGLDGATRLERVAIAVDGYTIEDTAAGDALLATPWLEPGAHTVTVTWEVSTACSLGDVGRRTYKLHDSKLLAVPKRATVDVTLAARGLFYEAGDNFELTYTVRGDAPTTAIATLPRIEPGPDACGPTMASPEEIAARRPRRGRPGCSAGTADSFASSAFAGSLADNCR